MNHERLNAIERTMQRAVNAANMFSNMEDRQLLSEGLSLLAEVRHAAYIINTSVDTDTRNEAMAHLRRVITGAQE